MCLHANGNKIRIAEEDIICYKELGPYKISPCYGMKYEEGKTYSIPKIELDCGCIEDGFHAFLRDTCLDIHSNWRNQTYFRINQRSNYVDSVRICYFAKCLIPKGSLYCSNSREIVSNCIKVLDIQAEDLSPEYGIECINLIRDHKSLTEKFWLYDDAVEYAMQIIMSNVTLSKWFKHRDIYIPNTIVTNKQLLQYLKNLINEESFNNSRCTE